jgi:hypothetical protein
MLAATYGNGDSLLHEGLMRVCEAFLKQRSCEILLLSEKCHKLQYLFSYNFRFSETRALVTVSIEVYTARYTLFKIFHTKW